MTTITINEKTAKGKSLLQFLSKFNGENFIQFENNPDNLGKVINKTVKKRGGITEMQKRKYKLISEIENGLKEVKLIQEGKLKKKTLTDMENENILLSKAIEKGMKTKDVSKATIFKTLGK